MKEDLETKLWLWSGDNGGILLVEWKFLTIKFELNKHMIFILNLLFYVSVIGT